MPNVNTLCGRNLPDVSRFFVIAINCDARAAGKVKRALHSGYAAQKCSDVWSRGVPHIRLAAHHSCLRFIGPTHALLHQSGREKALAPADVDPPEHTSGSDKFKTKTETFTGTIER